MHVAALVVAGFLLVVEFLTASACFALREFSFSRLEDICRERGREPRFGQIVKKHDEALLAADLLQVLVVTALAITVFTGFGLHVIPTDGGWQPRLIYGFELSIVVLLLTAVAVVFPWIVSRVAGERFLFFVWPAVAFWSAACRPIKRPIAALDRLAHRLAGRTSPEEDDGTSITEEIRTVIDEGQREGVLESEARTMIHRVMELQEEDTAAVMTPRTDMFCISVDCSLEEARLRLLEAGHSRVPVIGETTDDIIGILYAKDLLKHTEVESNGTRVALRDIVREPFYVPETTGVDHLLEAMKRRHVHVAIVVDEYGGVAGLVTMEDILEEIVGEIVDEYDADEEEEIRILGPGITEVEARVHIDDLNEQLDYGLPEDGDFDTLGGFVIMHLGRVPVPGEALVWRQLRMTVIEATERKIERVRIEVDESLIPASADEA